MDNKLPFALAFERQYPGPLDPTSVFATIAERDAYLNNATRYAGQVVSCLEIPGKLFQISPDLSEYIYVSLLGENISGDIVRYDGFSSVNDELLRLNESAERLVTDITYKAPLDHLHDIGNIVSLQETLDALNQTLANKADAMHAHSMDDISGLPQTMTAFSQHIYEIENAVNATPTPLAQLSGSEKVQLLNDADRTRSEISAENLKKYILSDLGDIITWEDSGADETLGVEWSLNGTVVGGKFDVIITMRVYDTGASVGTESISIKPLQRFNNALVHSKFVECIVVNSVGADGMVHQGSGTMGLLVCNFYQQGQHAYANQMTNCNEPNETAYISNYNDTQSSSYYYGANKLASVNDLEFLFSAEGDWWNRPAYRTKQYHYSGNLLNYTSVTNLTPL